MKTKIILVCIIAIVGCTGNKNQSNKSLYDYNLKRKDSIQIARENEIVAYANRPWKLGEFVDAFGDNTNEKYIKTQVEGVFSNSATSGSYLFAEILFSKSAAGIFLHEYNKTAPAEKIIGTAKIMLKNTNGEVLVISSISAWSDSGGLKIKDYSIHSNYCTMLKNFIQKSTDEIKVVINDTYSSSYKFTINATGFAKELSFL